MELVAKQSLSGPVRGNLNESLQHEYNQSRKLNYLSVPKGLLKNCWLPKESYYISLIYFIAFINRIALSKLY
jgi:hypothetical protein